MHLYSKFSTWFYTQLIVHHINFFFQTFYHYLYMVENICISILSWSSITYYSFFSISNQKGMLEWIYLSPVFCSRSTQFMLFLVFFFIHSLLNPNKSTSFVSLFRILAFRIPLSLTWFVSSLSKHFIWTFDDPIDLTLLWS